MEGSRRIDQPRPSRRVATLTPGSNGWELFSKARALEAAGVQITNLTIGEHDIPTAPEILDAMHRSAQAGHTGYAAIQGTIELRTAIATKVTQESGVPTGPENVLIVPGAQAGLFAAHIAALEPGDRALYVDPYYATYPGTIRAAGGVPVAVPAPAERGFLPDLAALRAAASEAGSLLINSPNNPTGVCYDRPTLEQITSVVTDNDMWLISDEVYEGQIHGVRHISPRALPGMAERTLVVSSMSKSYAMTGSRIGWIIGPEEAIKELTNLATHTTYGVPGFIQDAAAHVLSLGPEFEKQIAAPFHRRRAIANGIIARSKVARAVPSVATMYVMLDVSATGMDGRRFADRLLDEQRIGVMPGSSFGAEAAAYIRVALTVDDTAFEAAFTRLVTFMEECANA